VVGGFTPDSLEVAQAFYNAVICKTVPVSSCRAAEATKLMENIFRCINIALVNELKIVFTEMDIDIWEVVRAAATKPFGFMPFYPGPGLGGHCIPIDPFYLTWKAKEYGISTKFIELAGEVNTGMPKYVIQRTMLALNDLGKSLRGSRVLLAGLAYKKNVDDDRESPTYILWDELIKHGAEVSYYDPYCPVVRPSREHSQYAGIKSKTIEDINADNFDVVLISTAHDCVDHDAIAKKVPIVIDTRGTCSDAENIVKA
jgi:UDP-N-acetyl-D-glucosamine dehydrogenase